MIFIQSHSSCSVALSDGTMEIDQSPGTGRQSRETAFAVFTHTEISFRHQISITAEER